MPPYNAEDTGALGSAKHDQNPQNYSSAVSGGTISHAHTTDRATTNVDAGSLYSYDSIRDANQFVMGCFGRTFNNTSESYHLPTDDIEWGRLDKQHMGLLIGFGGLYACPDIVERLLAPAEGETKRVLDVGCGTGIWAMQMAIQFPTASVTGIDLAPPPVNADTCPPNLSFEIDDINNGLEHFHDQFDVVHMRCVVTGVKDIDKTFRDLVKCLKPGGLLLSVSGDWNLYDENKEKIKLAKEEEDQDVSGVSEQGSWIARTIWEANMACDMSGASLNRSVQTLENGFWDYDLLDPETAVNGSLYFPVGPWPVGKTTEETHMLHYTGVLMRQMFLNLHRAYHVVLLKHGMSQETLDEWSTAADDELNKLKFKLWVRYQFCWARRRARPDLSAPPLPSANTSPSTSAALTSEGQPSSWPTISQPVPYPTIEFYRSREENVADCKRRYDTFGEFPEPAVRRAWRRMIQL